MTRTIYRRKDLFWLGASDHGWPNPRQKYCAGRALQWKAAQLMAAKKQRGDRKEGARDKIQYSRACPR